MPVTTLTRPAMIGSVCEAGQEVKQYSSSSISYVLEWCVCECVCVCVCEHCNHIHVLILMLSPSVHNNDYVILFL